MVATGLFDVRDSAMLPSATVEPGRGAGVDRSRVSLPVLYVTLLGVIAVVALVIGERRYPPLKQQSTEDELELAACSEDELRVAQLSQSMMDEASRRVHEAGSMDEAEGKGGAPTSV